MNNTNVLSSWVRGVSASNGRKTFSTDGKNIYSYRLMIGTKDPEGRLVCLNYTANGIGFHSMTTSQHVNRVVRIAQLIFNNLDSFQFHMEQYNQD